jgi:hypothetical protein
MNTTPENSGTETETTAEIVATETEPKMQPAEWEAGETTAEIVAVILFKRQNLDKPKMPFPALMYSDFNETTGFENGISVKKYNGILAKPGDNTLIELIANVSPPVKLPDATMAELRDLENKIQGIWKQFDDWSLRNAEARWKSQRATMGKLGADGKMSTVPVISLEDSKNEALTKQRALQDNLDPLIARAKELLLPFTKIIFTALAKELVYMEIGERERAAHYNVLFVPSQLLRCGWALLIRLDGLNLNGEVFPAKMAAALGIGIEL